jgi:hypothetical protein
MLRAGLGLALALMATGAMAAPKLVGVDALDRAEACPTKAPPNFQLLPKGFRCERRISSKMTLVSAIGQSPCNCTEDLEGGKCVIAGPASIQFRNAPAPNIFYVPAGSVGLAQRTMDGGVGCRLVPNFNPDETLSDARWTSMPLSKGK